MHSIFCMSQVSSSRASIPPTGWVINRVDFTVSAARAVGRYYSFCLPIVCSIKTVREKFLIINVNFKHSYDFPMFVFGRFYFKTTWWSCMICMNEIQSTYTLLMPYITLGRLWIELSFLLSGAMPRESENIKKIAIYLLTPKGHKSSLKVNWKESR